MTSKNLFFKLMREDLKRKVWAVGLSFLSFFFWMPVMAAMRISDVYQTYERWIKNGTTFGVGITAESRLAEKLLDVVAQTVGLENPLNALSIAVAAIVMALTGFMYMHSRKQMDFYHSIPVRREQIFAVKYLNGILIVLSSYLVNMLLAFVVLAANKIDLSVVVPTGVMAFAVHAGGFLINYGLMVIAVMLTGNFFISILGGIVLFAYVPALIALVQGLMYLFFETVDMRGVELELMYVRTSPIAYYIYKVSEGAGMAREKYGTLMGSVGACVIVGAVMAVIALFLYKKRPSESAGKSMAFKITKTPIKILLVAPITIAASVLFWNIYNSLPWAVFGFVIGLVVTHCIVEIIYHFEFRKLFSNLHHMGISAAIALVVIAVFRFDLVGYDGYLPKESEFEGASVHAGSLNDWNQYGMPYWYEDVRVNGVSGSWRYMQADQYAADNMSVKDYAVISKLAEFGIEHAKQAKELKYANLDDTTQTEGYWTSLEIGYQLKNGKTVNRNYSVSVTELREVFDALYATKEYKDGVCPVLSYKSDNITGIYEAKGGEIQKVEADSEMQEEILNAYKEEMYALTLDERADETPVTSLRFLTIAEKDYISAISKDRAPNYTGDFRLEDMNQVNFFPVYPSFEKTLSLLRACGIDDFGPVDISEVDRIEIYSDYYTDEQAYYDAPVSYYEERVIVSGGVEAVAYPVTVSSNDGLRTVTLADDGTEEMRACMEMVLESSVPLDLAQLNGLQCIEYGISVRVYMKDVNEGRSVQDQEFVGYVFKGDEIPQFVKDAFNYDSFESKNINRGLNFTVEK